jgi:aryl-alcohol dehydrogenase-like predicted oxidoreductase
MDANQVIVEFIKKLAAEKGATPAQIALAWILAKKSWIVPIPGTRRLERLQENLGSVDIELAPDELTAIDDALDNIRITGKRYPEEFEKRVGK